MGDCYRRLLVNSNIVGELYLRFERLRLQHAVCRPIPCICLSRYDLQQDDIFLSFCSYFLIYIVNKCIITFFAFNAFNTFYIDSRERILTKLQYRLYVTHCQQTKTFDQEI